MLGQEGGGGAGAGAYWEKSPSVCVLVFSSKAVKTAPKCQVACQNASLCHPSLVQTKAPSERRAVAMRMGESDDLSFTEKS